MRFNIKTPPRKWRVYVETAAKHNEDWNIIAREIFESEFDSKNTNWNSYI